jgi:hypothetical protein
MLSSTCEPHTLSGALSDKNWHQAMEEEYNALIQNKTWHLVPPSNNKNLIDCKWVYRIKKRSDGTIDIKITSWEREVNHIATGSTKAADRDVFLEN